MKNHITFRNIAGFSIIEVMFGILIFAVGMLSLALLQGSLTRSQADSNSRAVAINLAERMLEDTRGFARMGSDGVTPAYEDITLANLETDDRVVAGVNYGFEVNLLDYRWDGDSFECFQGEFDNDADSYGRCVAGTPPAGSYSDYKLLEVTVSWNEAGAPEFRIDDDTETTDQLGSGSVTLSSIISSVATGANALVQVQDGTGSILPPIAIPEDFLNDNVSVALGENKFKSSTYATPETFKKKDDFVETRWDVVTYSNLAGNEFLRREEMVAVSCECQLDGTGQGRLPIVWAGDEYAGGDQVEVGNPKTIGENIHTADNDVSRFCDTCCRDHHDEGSNDYTLQYSPFVGDSHAHYKSSGGELVLSGGDPVVASGTDTYLEACRLVRIDGFFRVAQDLRQEQFFNFPVAWIDGTDGLDTYSAYVTETVLAYEEAADSIGSDYLQADPPPSAAEPGYDPRPINSGAIPGDGYPNSGEFPAWWAMSIPLQLASRGMYIDYLSDDLRAVIGCLDGLSDGETVDDLSPDCKVGNFAGVGDVILDRSGSLNPLEVLPFFDTQLTRFSDWQTLKGATSPVTVTNNELQIVGQPNDRGEVSRKTFASIGRDFIDGTSFGDNLSLIDSRNYASPPFIHRPADQVGLDQAALEICAVTLVSSPFNCPP